MIVKIAKTQREVITIGMKYGPYMVPTVADPGEGSDSQDRGRGRIVFAHDSTGP